jgi:Activator of Hsp90 ATPase homolog 1-like protein
LTYRDVGAALTWLEEAFGFEGQVLDEAGAVVRFRSGITLITYGQPSCLLTWAWDRPDVAVGTQLVEVDFTEHPDGTTTVVMTNRRLGDQQSRESHREGWEGSFDNLARLVSR